MTDASTGDDAAEDPPGYGYMGKLVLVADAIGRGGWDVMMINGGERFTYDEAMVLRDHEPEGAFRHELTGALSAIHRARRF